MTEQQAVEDVLSRVQKAFNVAFQVDPHRVTMDTIPGDVDGWDSMGHITLVNALEEEFHLSFDVDELMAMENVKEIVRIIEGKIGWEMPEIVELTRPTGRGRKRPQHWAKHQAAA